LSDQTASLVFFFQVTLRLRRNIVGQVSRRICEEGTGDVRAGALFENNYFLNIKYGDAVTPNGMKTYLSRQREGHLFSFDRATVRLQTLSSFDFGPKKGFCLAHFGQNLPPQRLPFLVSTGPNLWHPLLAGSQRGPWPYSTNPMPFKLRHSS